MKFSLVIIIVLILYYILMLFLFLRLVAKKRVIPQYSLEEANQFIEENRMRLLGVTVGILLSHLIAWFLYKDRFALTNLLFGALNMDICLAILILGVYKKIVLARKRIQQLGAQKEKEQVLD